MPGRVPSASGSVLRWPGQPPPARMTGPSRAPEPHWRKLPWRFTSPGVHLRAVLWFSERCKSLWGAWKPNAGIRKPVLETAETGFRVLKTSLAISMIFDHQEWLIDFVALKPKVIFGKLVLGITKTSFQACEISARQSKMRIITFESQFGHVVHFPPLRLTSCIKCKNQFFAWISQFWLTWNQFATWAKPIFYFPEIN